MSNKYSSGLAFTDFLFNLLLVFVALFLVALLLINPPEESADIDKSVSYIITIRWDPEVTHDVDLWITDGKETVGFVNNQGTNMSLDRDDIGDDPVSRELGISVNEEIISILAPAPYTYTANVHLYSFRDGPIKPIKVTWLLQQIYPHKRHIDTGEVYLTNKGEEKTLIRFTLNDEGNVSFKSSGEYPFIMNNRARGITP
jgi:hypothetical protein